MGYLRLALAVWVMFFHFGVPPGLRVPPGLVAVRCFFVLSGYVIALVLEKRYAGRLKDYLLLRWLRIYPTYLAAALLSLAAWSLVYLHWGLDRGPVAEWAVRPLPAAGKLVLVLQQLVLLGQEWGERLSFNGLGLRNYLLVQPAWTLGVELCFYLSAPWLLRLKDRWLWACVAWTLAYVWLDPQPPLPPWPATYPLEIGFFCLGALAWRNRRHWDQARLGLLAPLLLALAATPYLPLDPAAPLALALAPLLVAAMVPLLHRAGAAWRGDRPAGEISYALYLIHPLAGMALAMHLHGVGPWPRALILLAGTLALATVFWMIVEHPVERLRRRLSRD
ncbi:MAG TPA: acyltransferase [bacterium]|nr:acyltransferase [bacterium]